MQTIKLEKTILSYETSINKLAKHGFRIIAIEDNDTLILRKYN